MPKHDYPEGEYRASRDGCWVNEGDIIFRREDERWLLHIPDGKSSEWTLNRFMLLPDDFVIFMLPGLPGGVSIGTIRTENRYTIDGSQSPIILPGVPPGAMSWFYVLIPLELEEAAQGWVDYFYSMNAIPSEIPLADSRTWTESKPYRLKDQRIVTFKSQPKDGSPVYHVKIVMKRSGPHWVPVCVTIEDRTWKFDPKETRSFTLRR